MANVSSLVPIQYSILSFLSKKRLTTLLKKQKLNLFYFKWSPLHT